MKSKKQQKEYDEAAKIAEDMEMDAKSETDSDDECIKIRLAPQEAAEKKRKADEDATKMME